MRTIYAAALLVAAASASWAQQPAVTVVPAGHHAHRKIDGSIVIHGDWNYGSASAHQGIARPWPKIAVAGQTVPQPMQGPPVRYVVTEKREVRAAAPLTARYWKDGLQWPSTPSCPNGVCPRKTSPR
jgi:hypothetical protein